MFVNKFKNVFLISRRGLKNKPKGLFSGLGVGDTKKISGPPYKHFVQIGNSSLFYFEGKG